MTLLNEKTKFLYLVLRMLALSVFVPFTVAFAQPAIQWDRSFGGISLEMAPVVIQTADGGYIAGGSSVSPASGDKSEDVRGTDNYDYWIIKFSSAGVKEWDRTYGSLKDDLLTSIIQTPDGGYLLSGNSNGGPGGDRTAPLIGANGYWLVRLDAAGGKVWDKSFALNENQRIQSVSLARDGGLLLGGYKKPVEPKSAEDYTDFLLVKVDANGIQTWEKIIGGIGGEGLKFAEETPDHGYILAGISSSPAGGNKTEPGRGSTDYWVVRLDSERNKIWDKTIGGPDYETLISFQSTSDGGYIMGGTTYTGLVEPGHSGGDKTEAGYGDSDYWIVKIGANGSIQWDKTLGGSDTDEFSSIQETYDGNFIAGGSSRSPISGNRTQPSRAVDYWVVKLSAQGTVLWDKAARGGIGYDNLSSLLFSYDGGYLLAGESESNAGYEKTEEPKGPPDYWIVKLAPDETPGAIWLKSFSSFKQNGNTRIEWQTNTEHRSHHFEVEHSLDKQSWQILTSSNAKGISYVPSHYGTTHDTPAPGTHYYRLKMFDTDGLITFSKVDSVTFNPPLDNGIAWQKTLGGAAEDYLRFVSKTSDGGYILGGESASGSGSTGDRTEPSRGGSDYWIVKLSADGTKQWDKTYGGESIDILSVVRQTPDGGYIAGGYSYSGISGEKSEPNGGSDNPEEIQPDFWIVKVNADGVKEWDRTVIRPGYDRMQDLRLTSDGGYLAWGSGLLIKFSSTGAIEWQRLSVSYVGQDQAGNVQTADGGYIFLNNTAGGYYITKLNMYGAEQWARVYRGGGLGSYTAATVLKVLPDGFMIGGNTNDGMGGDKSEAGRGLTDYWIIKVDANGNRIWDKTFGSTGDDQLAYIDRTADGGYLLGGSSDGGIDNDKSEVTTGFKDAWMIRITADGTKIWDKSLGGMKTGPYYSYTGSSLLRLLYEEPDGSLILTGTSTTLPGDDKTGNETGLWIVELAGDGTKVADRSFDFPLGSGTLVGADGGLLAWGTSSANAGPVKSENSRGGPDFWVIKLKGQEEPPLPVTLVSFTVSKENTTALLTWQTNAEIRSSHFEVQHSTNAKNWRVLGVVNAQGGGSELHTYQFTHDHPSSGNNYYRLKMIDTDDSFAYSSIEDLSFRAELMIGIYPNPATEIIHLQSPDWSKVAHAQVLDNQGKLVYQSNGKVARTIHVGSFQPGMYFVKVRLADGTEEVRKIIVAR